MYLLKIKISFQNLRPLLVLAAIFCYVFIISAPVFAATAPPLPPQKACDKKEDGRYSGAEKDACVAGYIGGKALKTSEQACGSYNDVEKEACLDGLGKGACSIKNPDQKEISKCLNANPIIRYIRIIVNFLSAGVGIVITGSIIFAGIQYTVAGNNANTVGAAKKRIQDTLIALLAFFFIYAFLNWIIPGGLLFDI
jgi:hypothetical protein